MLAVIGPLEAIGFSRDSPVVLGAIVLGIVGMFAVMLVSLYRWAIGYSRSEFQEQDAAEPRTRVAARRAMFRRLIKQNGS